MNRSKSGITITVVDILSSDPDGIGIDWEASGLNYNKEAIWNEYLHDQRFTDFYSLSIR